MGCVPPACQPYMILNKQEKIAAWRSPSHQGYWSHGDTPCEQRDRHDWQHYLPTILIAPLQADHVTVWQVETVSSDRDAPPVSSNRQKLVWSVRQRGRHYFLPQTGSTTTCQKYLKAHIDGHFEELKYGCNLCEKRFKWRQQLKHHRETDHT